MSADRPDPSIDEPTEAPSESESESDGSTSKHRRDPTLIGIPQREPRRGGWFEAGARSTDPRLKLPELEEDESRSGWNSVADRPRKATESAFPGPPRSKAPPPPSISARKIQPPKKKRISSTPPPADEGSDVAAETAVAETTTETAPTTVETGGFAALGDPDAKNERLPSLAPQRPSEELVGLSEPPAAPDPVHPAAPAEYAATVIDSAPPEMELLPTTGETAAPVPEHPTGPEAAKTTVDEQAPELFDATPLAPISAADLRSTSQAEPDSLAAPFPMGDDDLSLRPPTSKRKWFILLGLVVVGITGLLVWKLNSPQPAQPVQVIDSVVPPKTDPTKTGSELAEPSANTAGEATGQDNTEQGITEQTGDEQDITEQTGDEQDITEQTGDEQDDERSLVEIMKAIEDANIPSQSRSISRMRPAAKARKARSHLSRATPHFRRKRYDRAIRYYVKALVFVPEHQEASEGIMQSLEARGENDKALSWAKRLVQLDSKNAMYWSYVGDQLRKLNRPDEARVIYERALQENRKNKAAIAGLKALAAE